MVPARRTSLGAAGLGVAATLTRALRQVRPWVGPLTPQHRPGFYERAADPGTGPAGEVLDVQRIRAFLLPGLKVRADVWRLLYRSTKVNGDASAVSATLMVPRGRRATALVAYAPGTHGLANYAAPSRLIARGLDWEAAVPVHLLARGHAVMMTDYEGLGTPGDHPYVVGHALGRNVLDALRAARSFGPAGLGDLPLGILGYSEGGNASTWAAELHPTYAPELDIAGVASGSIPADLEANGEHIEGSLYTFFAGYGALGLNAAYPELDLPRYLTPEGERHMYRLRRSSVVTATLRGPHFVDTSEMMTENVLHRPDWQARMRENKLGGAAPIVPVYLFTSRRDPLVPPAQTRDLARRWRARGADVTLCEVPALEHITGLVLGAHGAATWLDKRLRTVSGAQQRGASRIA